MTPFSQAQDALGCLSKEQWFDLLLINILLPGGIGNDLGKIDNDNTVQNMFHVFLNTKPHNSTLGA